jgi:hypothetical protein
VWICGCGCKYPCVDVRVNENLARI